MSSIYDWSLSAASNANADTDINWAEGQAPSTVNNSARFMMQRLKEFVSDLGAITAVGGSANVLTFSAKSSFSTYSDGIRLAFRAAADNTGAVTFNANAAGAKPVVKFTLDGETTLGAGEIQAGGIYEVIYSATLNGAAGGWLLLNPTQQQITPGIMVPHGSDVVPAGWLECDGTAVSRTTYANLFAIIGTKWGNGNGTTTFNLPELRGEFLRGWDHGRGVDTGRTFGSAQTEMIGPHTHSIDDPGHDHNERGSGSPGGTITSQFSNALSPAADQATKTAIAETGITIEANTGTENRPRNKAAMWIIKT